MMHKDTRVYQIDHNGRLIQFIVLWYGDKKSRVTICDQNYAWTHFFSGHRFERVEQFFCDVTDCYLLDNFCRNKTRSERARLRAVILSIVEFFNGGNSE